MSIAQCFIFPDTNLALHWGRVNQIDWCKLTNSRRAVIMIAPALVRELEYQKVHNRRAKLRDRAQETVVWLMELLDQPAPVMIRRNVELRFIEHEPQIDLAAEKLSDRIADDQLIASALEVEAAEDSPTFIATGDGGVRIKLRSRRVTALTLPEKYRLPAEIDDTQRELIETRQQLTALKSRLPVLTVELSDTKEVRALVLPRGPQTIVSLAALKKQLPFREAPASNDPVPGDPGSKLGLIMQQELTRRHGLSQKNAVDRYNEQLQSFFGEYAEFEKDHAAWQDIARSAVAVGFTLRNVGTAPATNIDLLIHLPDGVLAIESDELPKRPVAPDPPAFGQSSIKLGVSAVEPADVFRLPGYVPHPDAPRIDLERRVIEYDTPSIKHDWHEDFLPVYLVAELDLPVPRSIKLSVSISCNETPKVDEELLVVLPAD